MTSRLIASDKLKGLEVDNNQERYAAPSLSTGVMSLEPDGDPNCVIDWTLEFDCDTTNSKFWRYSAKFHDLMREVLRENGIDAT
jgi:hypothetical protein